MKSRSIYRISGNFRVVKFSCFIISCHNIFVDWVTHEKIFTATSLTRGEKKHEGLLRGYRVYPEPWEAAVGQELVNKNLGTPQTGTRVRYGSKQRNDYRTLTAAKGVACLLAFPQETVPQLQVAV